MTTQKQIDANRRNAQSSTGPKTEAGKAASAANAISHGLTAAGDVLLQDESVDAFEEMQRDMLADLAPQGALQGMLARQIIQLLWRLDRAARLEAELFLHGELAAKRDKLRAPGPNNAHRAALERAYADKDGKCPEALTKSLDEKDRVFEERRREILAVDMEILLGAPSAMVLVEREASAKAFDRLMRYEAMLQRSLNRTLAEFRSLKREAAKEAKAEAEAAAAERDVLQNEANSPQAIDAAPSHSARPPGLRTGETPWYSHEKGFLPMEANPAQAGDAAPSAAPLRPRRRTRARPPAGSARHPGTTTRRGFRKTNPIPRNPLKRRTIRPPDRSRGRPRPSGEGCSYPSGAGGLDSIHFPQAPGARSASLATRCARGAVAPSGPLCGPGANSSALTRAAGAALVPGPQVRSARLRAAPKARRQASGASARR